MNRPPLNRGKFPILGVNIDAVDYSYAVEQIITHARNKKPYAVSALAVHGVMTGFLDRIHQRRLNGLDLVVPDGQPVRWGLRLVYGIKLPDRVYGPELTLRVAEASAANSIPIYLYGSKMDTIEKFERVLQQKYPGIQIVGKEPSKFRKLTHEEKEAVVQRIKQSGAQVVFVGLGCPRQEVWAYEYRQSLSMPLLAVGAAFDFHAGILPQAPGWMQKRGLEWVFRLIQEPRRLWRRYLFLNPLYSLYLLAQAMHIRTLPAVMPNYQEKEESYG
ncbi:UDP-N-acetyl-D-mannosaminuronic acid transferase [Paenibacillus baekrokdamisoli]|uniref:UDP-N-acetyl-D-mannosaminuronic acid transferase n=1 Tax=Paenibacillus baekrokdamisoli TaxID=1712516 RepID=A0A3G9JF68_9BACL|nr:WecB/TagA/CpsF family glycosyltransferase [Paenibacillus baekrokdamisoli]MBB3071656.1 exopolysaccharide biosynthesis WecB/TagA/CpsF family protein [Paenibacillus baekrokdamisoli]BBH21834.1 UDP-N-acetyl-D-mannosaminuronic acid transferase [Paenibacillus baekrokdamisoli]